MLLDGFELTTFRLTVELDYRHTLHCDVTFNFMRGKNQNDIFIFRLIYKVGIYKGIVIFPCLVMKFLQSLFGGSTTLLIIIKNDY